MEHFWGLIDSGTYRVIMLTIHLLEAMGFVVILASALKAFAGYWNNKNGDPCIVLDGTEYVTYYKKSPW